MNRDGKVVEALPNTEYMVDLGDRVIRGYLSGKMRMHNINVRIGDTVEVKVEETGNIHRIVRRK